MPSPYLLQAPRLEPEVLAVIQRRKLLQLRRMMEHEGRPEEEIQHELLKLQNAYEASDLLRELFRI